MLDDIKAKKKKLDALRPFSLEALANLEAWYNVEVIYTSNAIEGNTLTRQETALVLEHGLTVSGKPLKDHQEAVDHQDALNFVRQLAKDERPISEKDIRDIHRLVTSGTLKSEAGSYSKLSRIIVGSAAKLPEPSELPALMGELNQWLAESKPSPEVAFEAHLRLVSIHPFSDGNGRTSRLLMNLILIKDGYPPLIISPERRNEYFQSLEKFHVQRDKSDYQTFLAERLNEVLDAYIDFLQPGNDPEKKLDGPSGPTNE